MMKVQVLKNVLQRNDNAARENRERLDAAGVACINLLGGAGSGKTTVLEGLLPALAGTLDVGVLEGDLATTRDAARIAALEVPVVQLLTEGGCHLTATIVQQGLERLGLDQLDLVVIENVGNLVCPANYDLGAHARIAVLSVTEGDDKPSKYPLMFKDVPLVLVTKCDLLEHTNFDIAAATRDLERLNPGVRIIRTDHGSRTGIAELAEWVVTRSRVGSSEPPS